jgi:gamma-glutamylcyclotransferase (GGCT)/AIG2-like uncharacterized protein YtfP
MPDRLFVYGTLLPERAPAELLPLVARLLPLGAASVRGRLYDLGPFPGAVPDLEAAATIRGRVFDVPDAELLAALDAYEGDGPDGPGGSGFVREVSRARLEDGSALECWIYAWRGDVASARPVEGGDYWAYRDARE